MTIVSQTILVESASARSQTLAKVSNERALEALNKAKALIMAMWQGTGIASIKQVAEYYETGDDAIESLIRRNQQELVSNGAKKIKKKELGELSAKLTESSHAPQFWIFSPRAMLCVGMMLSESEIATGVRTALLDIAESAPPQSEEMTKLKLENENLKLQAQIVRDQLDTRKMDNTMLCLHGAPTVLALRGMSDQVVEVEKAVTEVIDEKTGAKFKGQTLTQLKEYISKRYGTKFKSGADIERRLEKMGRGDLIAQMKRPVLQSYVPDEFIEEAVKVLTNGGDRQMLLGE